MGILNFFYVIQVLRVAHLIKVTYIQKGHDNLHMYVLRSDPLVQRYLILLKLTLAVKFMRSFRNYFLCEFGCYWYPRGERQAEKGRGCLN